MVYQFVSITTSLDNLASSIINAIPSIIEFIIIVLIGYIVANIVAYSIRVFLGRLPQQAHISMSIDLVAGAIKALIIIIALSIGLEVLNLPAAYTYIQLIANYLPKLAGAILLLTLGITLVNILTDYIKGQIGNTSDEFTGAIINILRFGFYGIIITLALILAIFSVIPGVNPYIFYSLIIGSIIIYAGFTIIEKVLQGIPQTPEFSFLPVYGKFVLYIAVLLIGIAIIVQPFANVTSIINTIAWGIAIAFAIALIPIVAFITKRFLSEIK
ncbi:mechanosensitive ion channel family protein [Sulfuracidifex metallicus]|uniref:Uncharacterized protein n=1 Tax=Sulfuracidifex metallicus DSM 6482 = JCM 9184 TaxID=523847 RepID=A0A6A9QUC7_SULME|nr:hypothetical protein [Sulfuracidifex metallicus]MUN29433.1 hypothetical protein [Sulfuracidifex metallicus DSM 6482 = JCM 9184]WOE50056.1 hypothetical protein RQ359_001556 [Sulfuracidifex metallicus DSM 6482 = JCM 9184]